MWVPHDTRDPVVDFVRRWSEKTEIGAGRFLHWLGVRASKFYDWRERYGRVNEHNSWVPRDFWLEPWEREAIIGFHRNNPLEGYRRLTFMMLDADVVAVSPSSVWRVLRRAGLLSRWKHKPSRKGTEQPPQPHQHWHIDVSYINVRGTFYYLCSVLDGYSRSIVHWDLRESMTEAEIEVILQRAREKYPEAKPPIISDNGPQFVARDFKEFIRIAGMTHVRTSPSYPQSNGKLERWHQSLKAECIRPFTPLTREDARRLIQTYVDHYNTMRLHSAIGYVTPHDMIAGRQAEIHAARDRKLEQARSQRQLRRQQQPSLLAHSSNTATMTSPGETEAGSAGDATMLSDNLVDLIEPMPNSAGADPLALGIHQQRPASDDRLSCLENPRLKGAESSLTENVTSPFQAEPGHRDPDRSRSRL